MMAVGKSGSSMNGVLYSQRNCWVLFRSLHDKAPPDTHMTTPVSWSRDLLGEEKPKEPFLCVFGLI